jgi:phytoene dehydrogenase-like protein
LKAAANPTTTSKIWDAIVIGGGHNGLIAAAYLARAGLDVIVLERRSMVGGCTVTEEIVPGYKFSRASYVNSLLRPDIIRDLRLKDHGFHLYPRTPSSFTPLLNGGHLTLGPDAESNTREIAKFSRHDAEAFPRYEAMLDRFARFLEPSLDAPPPDLASDSWLERWHSVLELGKIGIGALRLGTSLPSMVELLTAPARRILERWFESEPLRGTLATDAIIGAMASPSTPGSGYVLFHHVMGESDGARGVWAYVRGGMGALADAIASAARSHGVHIETDRSVAKILVEDGAAAGVALEDGTELRGRRVLSGVDPRWTFLSFLDQNDLPVDFRRHFETWDFSSAVTKINVAVDRIPVFSALTSDGLSAHRVGPQHHGTIHMNSTMHEIEDAYADAVNGRNSTRPIIEMTIPSALDDSLAPEGHHVISLFVQYTPYNLREGSWEDPATREVFADRVFDCIEEYAPGFKASVIGRDVLSPLDLERVFGITGGNIFHGSMSLDQLFWLRPVAGWARYRTPVKRLYLCGAGAHPGGGVLGAPGRNAARVALADSLRA